MPEHDFVLLFVLRLNRAGIRYMVTGSVASIVYGEPRLTHDIDLVVDLDLRDAERVVQAFPLDEFYCPPLEIIEIELKRNLRGHFNIIHHETGFRADVYISGHDDLHRWALENRKSFQIRGEIVWVAPIEYVIVRKLQYYHEGGSDKHLRDIAGMLSISSDQIDFEILGKRIKDFGLEEEWEAAQKA